MRPAIKKKDAEGSEGERRMAAFLEKVGKILEECDVSIASWNQNGMLRQSNGRI
jgi:hypothetical protein